MRASYWTLPLALFVLTGCPSGVTVDVDEDMSEPSNNNSPDMPSTNPNNTTTPPGQDMGMTTPPAQDMGGGEEDMGMPPEGDMGGGEEDMGMTTPPGPYEPARYDGGEFLSPLTPYIADRLRTIRNGNMGADDLVLMKVGDSNSVNNNMVKCFAEPAKVNLDGRTELQATIDYFNMKLVAGAPSFARDSLATEVGRTASWAISGNPSPMAQEISAINPRFALVSYGTNDMQQGATHLSALFPFYDNYTALLDELMGQGIIPIVTGLPPRGDNATATDWAHTYNDVSRAIAEARQVPYIDLLQATEDLPSMGLVGDGLHGNAAPDGACVFTDGGLDYGFNMRNYLTIDTLDRVRRVVLESQDAPDASARTWKGTGTAQDPILIESLPFGHAGDTTMSSNDQFDSYPSCSTGQNEAGPEVIYKLEVEKTTALRVMVFDAPEVDIDVHILDGNLDPAACTQRNDKSFEVTLTTGTYYFVLDTFVSSSRGEQSGPYLFVLSKTN